MSAKSTKKSTSIFCEWAEVTTAHGFLDFARAKSITGKLVWFLLIFASIVIMCYQLYRGVTEFSKHEWATLIQEVHKVEQDYPKLTFCNVNRLKYSKTKEYEMTLPLVSYLFNQLSVFVRYVTSNSSAYNYEASFIEWRKSVNFSYMDIFDKMAATDEQTFLVYPIGGRFSAVDTIEYGRCVQWDPAGISANNVGSIGATKFILTAQLDEYLPIAYNNHLGAGIALQISYSGIVELGKWTILNPGMRTSIALSVTETAVRKEDRMFLNPFALLDSKPPCAEDLLMPLSSSSQYSLMNCKYECFLRTSFYNTCGCIPLLKLADYRTCEAEEIMICISSSIRKEIRTAQELCLQTCLPPCNDRFAETQVSFTQFPNAAQMSEFDEFLTDPKYNGAKREEIIILDIFFASLNTKFIQQYEAMSFDNLVSSSGGLIGLWIGMSFLTIFQAIDFFLLFLKTIWGRNSIVRVK